jgi:hypothetical protein
MAMDYRPVVAWWFYGGSTPQEIAEYNSSWGLFNYAVTPSFNYYNHIYLQMYMNM